MAEPAVKKQKTEDGAVAADAAKKEAPEVPEPPKEQEGDAPKAAGPKIKDAVTFHTPDTTMNAMISTARNLLLPISDGGIRHLLAGARASVGVKSGRYMFEATILETIARAGEGSKPSPKSVLKVGFSTAGSSLLMGTEETDICFDADGTLQHNTKRTPLGGAAKFGRDVVVAVLLNLDKSSPNANTISLFKNGVRVCQPQPLPESLRGKCLYPTFTYRNFSVSLNFGLSPMTPLPFTCTMLQEAAVKDCTVTPAPAAGMCELILPVCMPDEGGFDWLDAFKAKNPQYTELSDRMIMEWAHKSGVFLSRGNRSNDKPEMKSGIPEMDDNSIARMIQTIAPLQQRNYIVMEIQGNLTKELRAQTVSRFPEFKKVAAVVMGEPTAEFKKRTQELILKEKQDASDNQFRVKKAEEARKKAQEKRQKEIEKAKKKADKERKRKLEEIKKAQEKAKKEAARKKAEAAGKELPAEEEDEEKKDEEMEEAEEEEEVVEEEPAEPEEPPTVELTDEEKKLVFRKTPAPDMALFALNTSFTKFSVPDKDEGFDEIKFEWSKAAKASEYVKKWIMDRKQTSRMEDLVPSVWFKTKLQAWQKQVQTWTKKQADYKAKAAKKAQEKVAKAQKKAQAERMAELKKKQKEAKIAKLKADGKEEEAKVEEEKEEPMEVEEEAEEEEEPVDFEAVEIFGVDEVDDIGGGMPLYKDFANEDWALMGLCYELYLLTHAFKKDCNDPDRRGIILEHLGFYYNKYYGKPLTAKSFGVESEQGLIGLAKECVFVNEDKVLESVLAGEMEYPQVFVKITEELRRHRALLVAMGDDSAKLKIITKQPAPAGITTTGVVAPVGPVKGTGKGKPTWKGGK